MTSFGPYFSVLVVIFTIIFWETGTVLGLGIDLRVNLGGDANVGLALGNRNLGACPNPHLLRFYNLAPNQQAATTGSIRGLGYPFVQDYRDFCPEAALQKYRTIDGTCNHPRNLGASFTPVARLLPPDYQDGIKHPRKVGKDGYPLPSARNVSLYVHPNKDAFRDLTIMTMQWGQWLDHDITALPVANELDKTIKCCGEDNQPPPFVTDKECFPIELPANEENHFHGSCMEFVRSLFATDALGRELQPREQVNSLTAFIDASQIYGSTEEVAAYLRGDGYTMRSDRGNMLPKSEEQDCILRDGSDDYCFVAGDLRVNEQPSLGAMHTIWMREHNRISHAIWSLNPFITKEEIFQKTRKIIGALQQVITYNEWLPIVLGPEASRLRLTSKHGRSLYNPGLDPRITNVFSAAAFRFGHSMIPDALPVGNDRIPLREVFNRPALVLDRLDDLVAGVCGVNTQAEQEAAQAFDRNFVQEITNHLFDPPGGPPGRGFDLVALNIQRGRDHGLPGYTKWRAFCGLRQLTGFDDTEALGPNVGDLAKVYRDVDDIDLFTGAAHEPVVSGLVGPTFKCLLGVQFFNLKYADRFFFDTDNQYTGFKDDQVAALRNVTLAKVICQNTNIPALPLNVFKFSNRPSTCEGEEGSILNPLISCDQLRDEGLDLSLFASH